MRKQKERGISFSCQHFEILYLLLCKSTVHNTPIFTVLLCLLVLYLYVLYFFIELVLLLLLALKGSLSSIHSFMQIAGNQHTHQDEMRCWTGDDMSLKASEVLSLSYSRLLRLRRILSHSDRIILNRLAWNWLQMDGLLWLSSFELSFLLQLKLLHIVFERHRNFCLNIIKIWSMLLCSSAHRSVWVARLTSDELVPPCPWAPATQLWFIPFPCWWIHLIERNTHYNLYIDGIYST